MADLDRLTAALAACAACDDAATDWPAEAMGLLAAAGANRWVIPPEFGGDGWSPEQVLAGYEAVGRGHMAAILILTQRDAACDLILTSPNEELKRSWLPRLARGEAFTTVGISQVTTSHQAGPPALAAEAIDAGGYCLRGFMPWASGADQADVIVTSAVLADGMQILAVVPRGAAGMRVEPPLRLMALSCARTSRVICEGTPVTREQVLRGPMQRVLAMRSTVKPMVVSSSGLGLAGALVDQLAAHEATNPPEVRAAVAPLRTQYRSLRARLYAAARDLEACGAEEPSSALRIEVNDLVVRLAIAAMTFAKGTGYVAGHPVERLVREAMFFLVWSAPDRIRSATLERLLAS